MLFRSYAAKPTARALGLSTGGVRAHLVRCGGIRPAPRRRSTGRLSLAEREETSRGLAAVLSLRAIAEQFGRAASTVGREVVACGGRGRHRAAPADREAWTRARRPQTCKLATRPALRAIVGEKLTLEWAPGGRMPPGPVGRGPLILPASGAAGGGDRPRDAWSSTQQAQSRPGRPLLVGPVRRARAGEGASYARG